MFALLPSLLPSLTLLAASLSPPPVHPVAAAAAATASALEIELEVGYRVVDRRLVAVDGDELFVDGETVVAWTRVVGMAPGALQHVWYRDGVEVARHSLPVGASPSWRSWSRHQVRAGLWEVRVLDTAGEELAVTTFIVADPTAGDDDDSCGDDDAWEHDEHEPCGC